MIIAGQIMHVIPGLYNTAKDRHSLCTNERKQAQRTTQCTMKYLMSTKDIEYSCCVKMCHKIYNT